MSINTAAGSRFFIGTKAAADSLADFKADTYIEVGEVEDLGEFGDQSNPVTFTALSNSRTRKFKGTKDAGDLALVLGFDKGDVGQQALIAAEADSGALDYNFKIVLNDGDASATPAIPDTTVYFKAKVMSNRIQAGQADNVVRANASIAINSAVLFDL